jgi:hypothetical protein
VTEATPDRGPCSAATHSADGNGLCLNGFPAGGSCFGTDGVPYCCREEACGQLLNQWGGKPPDHMVGYSYHTTAAGRA